MPIKIDQEAQPTAARHMYRRCAAGGRQRRTAISLFEMNRPRSQSAGAGRPGYTAPQRERPDLTHAVDGVKMLPKTGDGGENRAPGEVFIVIVRLRRAEFYFVPEISRYAISH